VRTSLLGIVAMMEDEQPLGEEEEQETETDERGDPGRVPDGVDRLG
jgi:hypothetical protein